MNQLAWLFSLQSKGIILGLANVRELCTQLGNPVAKFKSIHIAGTNGKGSVAVMLYNVLRQAGYRVGLYTSPHLARFNERIVVEGREITNRAITRLVKRLRGFGTEATFFEFTTLMAFAHFAEKRVDYAVIETGMGGRLDATNIINPVATVITNISMDHQQYLGDTIEKIAWEKAGIIKQGVPVITTTAGSALDVINRVANSKHAPVVTSGALQVTPLHSKPLSYQHARFRTRLREYDIKTRLLGRHQLSNIGAVIMSCERLGVGRGAIERGIAKAYWPARLEIISRNPLVILDGSHNPEGFANLRQFMLENLNGKRITLVMGISSDKDIPGMVPLVDGLAERVIICRARYRGAPTAVLKRAATNSRVYEIESVADAVSAGLGACDGAVLITGSLYVAGELMDQVCAQK